MPILAQFAVAKDEDKETAIKKLIEGSTPDFDYFLLLVLSVLMATFGLLLDSGAVVIGSMLIAPILYPVLSIALGMVMSDYGVIARSSSALVKGIGLSVVISAGAAVLFSSGQPATAEIIARTEPSLAYFLVAVVAGIAASYTLVKPELNETIPGIAISVALLPPLAAVGIGIAKVNPDIIIGATVLFIINVLGIVFASLASFSLLDLYRKRKVAAETIVKEDARVFSEKRQAEAIVEESERQTKALAGAPVEEARGNAPPGERV